jgi:acyl-CoA thioesterase
MIRPVSAGSSTPGPGPFSALLGLRLVRADADSAVMEADPGPEHANGGGILHGGYLSALLDSTTGWAVHARTAEGVPAPHVHLSVQFLRAGVPGRRLTCTARCLRAGRRTAAAEAEIVQDGRVLARATSTHSVLVDGLGS